VNENMTEHTIYMTTWEPFLNHGIQDPAYLLLHTAKGMDSFCGIIKDIYGDPMEALAEDSGIVIIDPEDPRYNYFYHWAVATKETAMWFKLAYQDNVTAVLTEAQMQQCLDDVKSCAFQYLDKIAHGNASPARFIAVDTMTSAANALGLVRAGVSKPMFLKAIRFTTTGVSLTLHGNTTPGIHIISPGKSSA
jgi:hypothetical protein